MTAASPSVGIVGGGLAGLAAASILCERGFRVELFEARRHLGGRAGSFIDPATSELVDHCQHVAMGCCTAFLDFCRRTGVDQLFRRDKTLYFFSPEGKCFKVYASPWLPAPLHLGPSLMRLGFLSRRERWGIAKTLLALDVERVSRPARQSSMHTGRSGDLPHEKTIGQWLRQRGQSQQVIDRFWSVVLVSALGETVERASLQAARKVFVDGFMSRRDAYHICVPQAPLGEIYENGVARWLRDRGVGIHLESRALGLKFDGERVGGLQFRDGERSFDHYIVATPWHVLPKLLGGDVISALKFDPAAVAGSPITSIHLWFDRPITNLPHAVLVDRLTQWLFRHVGQVTRPAELKEISGRSGDLPHEYYYQAVISASGGLKERRKEETLAEVLDDLQAVFPATKSAELLRHRIVTQQDAVFSYRPGLDKIRPPQQTPISNLYLAGDWTHTGWPSTMESAVRSGYAAAKAMARLRS